ncbi:hypothetical protein D3C77_638380 [compost metagenome]
MRISRCVRGQGALEHAGKVRALLKGHKAHEHGAKLRVAQFVLERALQRLQRGVLLHGVGSTRQAKQHRADSPEPVAIQYALTWGKDRQRIEQRQRRRELR